MEAYDVFVLGTGVAGLTAAIAAHDGGQRVAVFEKAEKSAARARGPAAWCGSR